MLLSSAIGTEFKAISNIRCKNIYLPFTKNKNINTLNAELNPICHLLALLGAHHILHVSRIRVKHISWGLRWK
jgi:hypothetical protein